MRDERSGLSLKSIITVGRFFKHHHWKITSPEEQDDDGGHLMHTTRTEKKCTLHAVKLIYYPFGCILSIAPYQLCNIIEQAWRRVCYHAVIGSSSDIFAALVAQIKQAVSISKVLYATVNILCSFVWVTIKLLQCRGYMPYIRKK